jgi:hypothetical protein
MYEYIRNLNFLEEHELLLKSKDKKENRVKTIKKEKTEHKTH